MPTLSLSARGPEPRVFSSPLETRTLGGPSGGHRILRCALCRSLLHLHPAVRCQAPDVVLAGDPEPLFRCQGAGMLVLLWSPSPHRRPSQFHLLSSSSRRDESFKTIVLLNPKDLGLLRDAYHALVHDSLALKGRLWRRSTSVGAAVPPPDPHRPLSPSCPQDVVLKCPTHSTSCCPASTNSLNSPRTKACLAISENWKGRPHLGSKMSISLFQASENSDQS